MGRMTGEHREESWMQQLAKVIMQIAESLNAQHDFALKGFFMVNEVLRVAWNFFVVFDGKKFEKETNLSKIRWKTFDGAWKVLIEDSVDSFVLVLRAFTWKKSIKR